LVSRTWWYAYRLLLALILAGIANFWGFSSPNGFTKCASIVKVDELPAMPRDDGRYFLDVRELLSKLPEANPLDTDEVFVDPDARVQYVFGKGKGDCAQRSRALARVLQSRNIPYRIIWIMHGASIRSGSGHTVVECPLQLGDFKGMGVVDMLEGGVAIGVREPLKLEDLLAHEPAPDRVIEPLARGYDERSPYYSQFQQDSAIGVSMYSEVNRYADAMASWHVSLGFNRAEKLVYILGAMVFGYYPNVYMTPTELGRFDPWFRFEIWLARSMVWSIRLLLLMGAAHALYLIWEWTRHAGTPAKNVS
jgi:hypothetical protein